MQQKHRSAIRTAHSLAKNNILLLPKEIYYRLDSLSKWENCCSLSDSRLPNKLAIKLKGKASSVTYRCIISMMPVFFNQTYYPQKGVI